MANPTQPETHRALVLTDLSVPLTVQTLPKPTPTPGSAIIRMSCVALVAYTKYIFTPNQRHGIPPFPTPMVPGFGGVGRVSALGPDASTLKEDQLVFVDVFVHARDDPVVSFMQGYHGGETAASRALAAGEWRDGSMAEFVKVPLENVHVLNEELLYGKGLGLKVEDLPYIGMLAIPYGGLRDLEIKSGETVVIAPATGVFGGCAVQVALAMGARVLAAGRNEEKLRAWEERGQGRLKTVVLSGEVEEDVRRLQQWGPVDAYQDWTPHVARTTTHIKACLMALRGGGRASFMGGIQGDVAVPYNVMYRKNIKLSGRWMYDREHVVDLIKMVEVGVLGLGEKAGHEVTAVYGLEGWDEAIEVAAEKQGWGKKVLIKP